MFRVILLVVALAIGGGAAWLAINMRADPVAVSGSSEPAAQTPLQQVLVATADVGRGEALGAANMRWQSWPDSALNTAYISRSARPDALEVLSGSVVRSPMISGEPIREEKLLPPNGGFLAAMLPPGKRAMAVRVSPQTTAGGLIVPKDRVDVVHTAGRKGAEGQTEQISRTILRNIPVLAIDQTIDDKSGAEKPKDEREKPAPPSKTATLEVDAVQAEILANAEATGTLSLALRSVADSGEPMTVSFPQVSPQPISPKPATIEAVEILRGGRSAAVKGR